MTNTFGPILKSVSDFWNFLTNDQNLAQLLSYRKGSSIGNDWQTKVMRAQREEIYEEYKELDKRFKGESTLCDFLWDHKLKLTVLAGLERLYAIRQAYPVLKSRTGIQSIMNRGLFKGYFRGYFAYVLPAGFINYHLSCMKNPNYLSFYAMFCLLETVTFPLDTIRTVLYADLGNKFKGYNDCIKSLVVNNGWTSLFKGLQYKLGYNAFYLYNLRNMYENSSQMLISYPLWVLSYALLSLKTRTQLTETPLSFRKTFEVSLKGSLKGNMRANYGGAVPFFAMNTIFMWYFYNLLSEEPKNSCLDEIVHRLEHEFKTPAKEVNWS